MYKSYQIVHRIANPTKWELVTGDLVLIKQLDEPEWQWVYALSERIGQLAVVLGRIMTPHPGDEGTYIIKYVKDGLTEVVDWEEVELVSRGGD